MRLPLLFGLLTVLVACDDKETVDTGPATTNDTSSDGGGDGGDGGTTDTAQKDPTDKDGDGYDAESAGGDDCDDDRYSINPGADDIVGDGVDQNCDGLDGVDADGDGQASEASGGDDCNDEDATIYVDADDELGDGIDQNCDGNDGYDADGDGFEAEDAGGDDCDDDDASINPGESEVCGDGLDNDCDGSADDEGSADAVTWYADADDDGYGSEHYTLVSCAQPDGYVEDATDCDDLDAEVFPGANEVCNDEDDDCDGDIDEPGADGGSTWYADNDGDTYGDASVTAESCDEADGYVDNGDDCNDADADIHPGASETCDDTDQDCDSSVDEDAVDAPTWYEDADGDTYGDSDSTTRACDEASGWVSNALDCDDSDAAVSPAGTEVCDDFDVDEDCDGLVNDDDGSMGEANTFYADADADGYGDPDSDTNACEAPTGYVSDATDCDDSDGTINPGAPEVCDEAGVDEDCDGLVNDDDKGAGGASVWYEDADGDGYGNPASSASACDSDGAYVSDSTDCDDDDADVNPGASEICDADNVDEDCSGDADDEDENATGQTTWYADSDGDGYGDPDTSWDTCDQLTNTVDVAGDCDDSDASANPDGTDVWYDGVDGDCDGGSDYDADGDGDDSSDYGGGDCDDTDASIGPSATEVWYDGDDTDCDGLSDYDADVDGYDSQTYGGEDCDDMDASVYPEASEVDATKDNDCDGEVEVIPEAVASYDADTSSLLHCDAIYLDGSGSSDPDGTSLSYAWEVLSVPETSEVTDDDVEETTDESPTVRSDVVGDYSFGLTVSDELGNTSEQDSITVTVDTRLTNSGPVAEPGDDQTSSSSSSCSYSSYTWTCDDCSDVEFTLDASSSTDADGDTLSHAWEITSGESYGELSASEGDSVTATMYGISATYGTSNSAAMVVTLSSTDCYGATDTDTVTLTFYCEGS